MKGKARAFVETVAGKTLRVAVLGAKNAGKTTFTASLCQLLRNPQDGMFNGWTPEVGNQLDPVRPFKRFPLAETLSKWSEDDWSDETVDVSQLRLPVSFHREAKRTKRFELQILDIPGERVADFGMFGRDYGKWSDFVEDHANGLLGRIRPLEVYFEEAKTIVGDWAEKSAGTASKDERKILFVDLVAKLVEAYKNALKELDGEYSTFLSPSVVRLDEKGTRPDWGACPVGLDEKRQFVPLPREVRTKENRKPLRAFEKAYDDYVATIVSPVVKWLASADQAIYLVDVLSLLNDGCDAYATQKAMGDAALSVFSRRAGTAFGRAWNWLFHSRIAGIQLLATQADRVPDLGVNEKDQQTNPHGNMKKLLREIHGRAVLVVDGAKKHFGTVTAVVTTKQKEKGKSVWLFGPFEGQETDSPDKDFPVQFIDENGAPVKERTVPRHWPCDEGDAGAARRAWKPGEYGFAKTKPFFPTHVNIAPVSREMDGVIQRLFDLGDAWSEQTA